MPLILLAIGVALIIYNYRAIKVEEKVSSKSENTNTLFQSLLQDKSEYMDEYKIEIGLLRKDMAESLTELQEEILEIKNNINNLKKNRETFENIKEFKDESFKYNEDIDLDDNEIKEISEDTDINLSAEIEKNNGIVSEIDFSQKTDSNKTQSIKKLLDDGLTEDQICYELSVSKGEVLLVKGLFKK